MKGRRDALRAAGLAATAPLWPAAARGKVRPRRVGIAFSSGGLHGLVHVGAIRAFRQFGLRPHAIAGCSVGAIAGALWAAGLPVEEIEAAALDVSWREADRWRLPRYGLARLGRLERLIDERTNGARIESLDIAFAAVATNLATGRSEILTRGALAPAVAASCAVPIRYEPVEIDGRQLVDGALTAPLPVDAARVLGADFVIAIDVAYRPYEEAVTGITGMAFQMFHIMVNQLIAEQVRRADHAIRLDVHSLAMGSGERALIDFGEKVVREAWPALRQLIGT
ncbi:MAG: patatin-like phospholipase family protein [Pseudomonadota bacterium]